MSDHNHDTGLRSVVRRAAFAPSAVVLLSLIVIWAATGAGYFWPMWAALGFAIPAGFWFAVRWARLAPFGWSRAQRTANQKPAGIANPSAAHIGQK